MTKAVRVRIAEMSTKDRDALLEVSVSLLEIIADAAAESVDKQLRKHGLLPAFTEVSQPSVYFIQAVDGGPIKIGFAADPAKRLRELQRSSPHVLTIVASEPGNSARERELHAQFSEWRLHGEWFSDESDALNLYVAQLRAVERESEEVSA